MTCGPEIQVSPTRLGGSAGPRVGIDDAEVGHPIGPRIRVALEVSDTMGVTERLVAAGASLVASPRETPWRSLNARLDAPAGLQLTLFEELEPLSERTQRPGFGTNATRTVEGEQAS